VKTIVEVLIVAGVATGVIIYLVTGSLWQFVPIGLGLWVGTIARTALEKDIKSPSPKQGEHK
jgi:type IV secretory pathway TrbD component